VFEICARLFLNSKSEREIGKGQNCFTNFCSFSNKKVTENPKHHTEVLFMHSIMDLNSSPSSFQYLLVQKM